MLASACYLPLTRGRPPRRVLAWALGLYAATMAIGRLAILRGGSPSAYVLYIGHECAGTVLTIHWGVYILDQFTVSEARRLFPLLYTASQVGRIFAGGMLKALAGTVGASNLLVASVALAAVGAFVAQRRSLGGHAPEEIDDAPEADMVSVAPVTRVVESWKTALESPLVRAIAATTALMVFLRYGLRLLSLDAVNAHFGGDENANAAFFGGTRSSPRAWPSCSRSSGRRACSPTSAWARPT